MTEASIPERWHVETAWEELPLAEHPGGVRTKSFAVGHPDDPDGPFVVWVSFPPDYAIAPHTHGCDYTEMIVSGSQQVTRRWHGPGTIRIVRAGTVYGPLIAGPEGATAVVVFASRRAINPVWVHLGRPTQTADGYEPVDSTEGADERFGVDDRSSRGIGTGIADSRRFV